MSTRREPLRVRLLPSAVSGDGTLQYATSYLIGERIAIDAGSVGMHGGPEVQGRIRHVLLTHSHSDHIASLAILLENTLTKDGPPLEVWAGKETLACLERDVFNDRVYPRLSVLERPSGPAMLLHELVAEREVTVGDHRVLPIEVDHTVPTFAFLISGAGTTAGGASVIVAGDTGPTERLWRIAAGRADLAAVFLEASFPDAQHELARVSKHLTPRTFAAERAKLAQDVAFVAVHLKPRYRERIVAELEALAIPGLEIGVAGKEYRF